MLVYHTHREPTNPVQQIGNAAALCLCAIPNVSPPTPYNHLQRSNVIMHVVVCVPLHVFLVQGPTFLRDVVSVCVCVYSSVTVLLLIVQCPKGRFK